MSERAIFALPLSHLNMSSLNRWAKEKQLVTIGDLVSAYHYRFVVSMRTEASGSLYTNVGLSWKAIKAIKTKLAQFGLTPDDWPALVRHNELLSKLSKAKIENVPLREVVAGLYGDLYDYMCSNYNRELQITVGDFIKRSFSQREPGRGLVEKTLLKSKRKGLVKFLQQLKAKGFTKSDGIFLSWDPLTPSMDMAENRLKERYAKTYQLTAAEVRKFARIIVNERWLLHGMPS